MRIAVISHSYVLNANRGKLSALAQLPGLQILLIVPRVWRNRDIGQRFQAERSQTGPLATEPLRSWSLGSGSLITYSPLGLLRLLRSFRPDLVHLEEEPWSFAALEVSVICRLLVVPFTFFTWENTPKKKMLPFRFIRRSTLRRARAAVAGNSEAKTLLEDQGFRKTVAMMPQLGVDTTAFRPTSGVKEGIVVGYVGRLVQQKGLSVLLRAFSQLSPHARLMVVGSGPLKDFLLRSVEILGLRGRVELLEGVAHQDVPRYLERVSVLVLPSLTTATWKEQFGHVLVEAMACGVPVIGSDSGAIPEVIGDAGIVVPEGNAKALAEALEKMISTPPLRTNFGARGRARALSQYSNDIVARRLAVFWEGAIKGVD